MKGTKYVAYIVVLLIMLFSIIGLSILSRNFAIARNNKNIENETAELYAEFNTKDISLYWIGTFPEELSAIASKVIFPSAVNESDMPVKSPEFHSIERDPDGNIVNERTPVSYAENLYIVINGAVLSESQYAVIRSCIVDNGVKIIVLGDNAIKNFRDYLILPALNYNANDSMEYSMSDGSVSHVLGQDIDFNATPSILVRHIMGEIAQDGDRSVEDNTNTGEG